MIENKVNISKIIIARRMDSSFFRTRDALSGLVSLSKYVNVKGGKRMPKGDVFTEIDTDYLYLRISDIGDFERIDYSLLKNISPEIFKKLERYEIHENEIAFSIAGTIGRVFIVKNIPSNKRVILTENCAKLSFKKQDVSPEFLKIVLNLPLIQQQVNYNRIQTTIPKIGLDRISKLQIPVIPSKKMQQEIVDIYNKASNEKQAKEQEAKALLDSIDEYLIQCLEIDKYAPEDKKIFRVNISQLMGKPFDVRSNQQTNEKGNSKFGQVALDKIASLRKGKSITKDKIRIGDYPVIAGGQSSPYSHDEYNQIENAITVSASGAYSGFVWYHDYKFFASDCTVIRSKNEQVAGTEYIYFILKFKQEEIYRMQRGSGQPHVYSSDLAKIQIPIPPLSKQQEIIETISTIREKASILQIEASQLFENAKQKIEKIILG